MAGNGTPISPDDTGYTQGCITAAQSTVSDADGNIWIANQCGGTVTFYRGGDPDDHFFGRVVNSDSRHGGHRDAPLSFRDFASP